MLAPEYGGDGKTPATGKHGNYKDPLIGFPAHWAPNDIEFYKAIARRIVFSAVAQKDDLERVPAASD